MLGRSLIRLWLMGGVIGCCSCCCCCVVVVTLINRSEVVAINYGFPLIGLSSSFGVMKNALNAKQMNTIPPTMVTGFLQRDNKEKTGCIIMLLKIDCDILSIGFINVWKITGSNGDTLCNHSATNHSQAGAQRMAQNTTNYYTVYIITCSQNDCRQLRAIAPFCQKGHRTCLD